MRLLTFAGFKFFHTNEVYPADWNSIDPIEYDSRIRTN